MNITESNDVNTVLQHLLPDTPARSSGRPDSEQAQAAAARLADKARKALAAGLSGADVEAAWSTTDTAGPLRLELPVSDLAPHPHNVRTDVGDVTELAASIAELGVLNPLTVVSMDAFLDANPDLRDVVEIGDWVVLAGHRRLAAAIDANLKTVPVIVRDDAAAAPTASVVTMIAENVQRAALSPMEEARAFGRLRDAKWSERKIAKATGVSAGQVHKRLSLLRLPEKVAVAVATRSLTVSDALTLLELPDGEIERTWKQIGPDPWSCAARVVERRKAQLENEARIAEARAPIEKAGIEITQNPGAVIGPRYWQHRHPDDTTLEQITNPQDTIAWINPSGTVFFYSRTIPLEHAEPGDDTGDASGGSTRAGKESDARQEQREADKQAAEHAANARAEACQWLISADPPDPAVAAEILANYALIDGGIEYYQLIPAAAEWCGKPLDIPEGADWQKVGEAEERWVEEQAAAGGITALRASLALALADLEKSLPAAWTWDGKPGVWSPRDIRHVRLLVDHADHDLSEIELQVIAHSEATHAAAAATSGPDGQL
ncbi:MAG: ParB/RepB/Spo0J family partition protein [Labedaea sp.]